MIPMLIPGVTTPGYCLEAHTRFSSIAMPYLNRIVWFVRPQIND